MRTQSVHCQHSIKALFATRLCICLLLIAVFLSSCPVASAENHKEMYPILQGSTSGTIGPKRPRWLLKPGYKVVFYDDSYFDHDAVGLTAKAIRKQIAAAGFSNVLGPIGKRHRYRGNAVRSFDDAQRFARSRKPEEAAMQFVAAYKFDMSLAVAAYNAGLMFEQAKQYDNAISAFEVIYETHDPANTYLVEPAGVRIAHIYLSVKNDRKQASRYLGHSISPFIDVQPPALQPTTPTGPPRLEGVIWRPRRIELTRNKK